MSHAMVLVISKTGTYEEIEKMLAPYNEQDDKYCLEMISDDGDRYLHNPNAKWDWWQIGGRWAGEFKPTKKGEGIIGEKSFLIEYDPYKDGNVDSIQVKYLDKEFLKKIVTYSVLDEKGWYEKSLLGWFGCSRYDGYCCVAEELTIREILEHFKFDHFGINDNWTGYRNEYVDLFIKTLHRYYHFDKEKRVFILRPEFPNGQKDNNLFGEDITEQIEFFRNKHWSKNYYKRFLEKLDPDMWLTMVDYHI